MANWTQQELETAYKQVLEKGRTDAAFRAALVADPRKAIAELTGKEIPETYRIRIVEQDPAYDATFFLPAMVSDEFTADDLDAVGGGACGGNICGAEMCGGQITK